MKKLFLKSLMICLGLFMSMQIQAAEKAWVEVSNAQQLSAALKADHSAHIRLLNDIDLWPLHADGDYLFDFTFSGKIESKDGKLYSLSNTEHTLFAKVKDAEFFSITINNGKFTGLDTSSGMVADDADNVTLLEVYFCNIQAKGDAGSYDCDNMGTVFGVAKNCTFTGVYFANCQLISDGSYIGVACGNAIKCKFEYCHTNMDCMVWGDGNLTSYNSGFVGGFCGGADNCTFNQCFNLATVLSDDDRVGGIIGYGTNGTTLTDCRNAGLVRHSTMPGFGRLTRRKVTLSLIAASAVCFGASAYAFNAYCSYLDVDLAVAGEDELIQLKDELAEEEAEFKEAYTSWSYLTTHLYENGLWQKHMQQLEKQIAQITEDMTAQQAREVARQAAMQFASVAATVFEAAGAITITAATSLIIYDKFSLPDELGGIAGTIDENSSLLRCTNIALVEGKDHYIGGIAGYAENATIESCYNRNLVRGNEDVGGIVGYAKNCTIKNSLNTAAVTSKTVSNTNDIIGNNDGGNSASGNYYLAESDRSNTISHGYSQEKFPSGEVAKKLNEVLIAEGKEPIWRQNLGEDFYPTIHLTYKPIVTTTTANYSLEQKIYTSGDFYAAIAYPNAQLSLERNIDLTGGYFNMSSKTKPFAGKIKGNGYTLKNLSYEASQDDDTYVESTTDVPNHIALFPFVSYATFENFNIENFRITERDDWDGRVSTVCLFAAESDHSKYTNITVRNSSILINDDNDDLDIVAGLACISKSDVFTSCKSIGCRLQAESDFFVDSYVGAISSKASNSKFIECYNTSELSANDEYVGGIVAYADGCQFESCLNVGKVTGRRYVGGITGEATNTTIKQCVNVGTVSGDVSGCSYLGGIVGHLKNSGSTIDYCLGFGNIENGSKSSCGATVGTAMGGATEGANNKYNFNHSEFGHLENYAIEKINSGELAYTMTDGGGKRFLYQSLDNGGWCTKYPVPISDAGVVYANEKCNGTAEYSNIYQNTQSHEQSYDRFGICKVCGSIGDVSTVAGPLMITDASDLAKFAYAVNKGQNYGTREVHLFKDIDCSDINSESDFTFNGIGNSEHPFTGTFNGMKHTIKNLKMEKDWGEAGLFPDVTGTTNISNVVLDNTCVILSNCYGAGGIVGVTRGNCTLNLSRCGFEGYVSGSCNVASMLGAVFESTNHWSNITINKCYNTGIVNGGSLSAAICGYANDNVNVTDTWNAGTVTGNVSGMPFFRYTGSKTPTYTNCYDVNTQSKINKLEEDDLTSGKLCHLLNNKVNGKDDNFAWYQKIGEDGHPMLTKRGDGTDLVYMHQFAYCDAPTVTDAEYNNSSDALPAIMHDYDEDGFCHRAEGVEHYEPASLEENVWKVSNMGNLYWIAQEVNDGAEQHDIALQCDLTDNKNVIVDGNLNANTATFRQWIPIGTESVPLTKNFNGGGYTVSGLYKIAESNIDVGLLGVVQGKVSVSDVVIKDSYFGGDNGVKGSVVGVAIASNQECPAIMRCGSHATIVGSGFIGGIVGAYGFDENTTPSDADAPAPVSSCYSMGKVVNNSTAEKNYSGGIIGMAKTTYAFNPDITMVKNSYYLDGSLTECASPYAEAKSESAFKLGEVALLMNESSNGWTQDITTDAAPKFGAGGVTYTRTVTPGNWASLVLPCKVESTDDVQLYTFKTMGVYDNKLTLVPAESVPANTPCFFKTKGECSTAKLTFVSGGYEAPTKDLISVSKQVTANVTLYLYGTYKDITVNPEIFKQNYFVAQNQLWWGEEAFNLPAFRGYLTLYSEEEYAPAKGISIVVEEDGETTQIGEIRDGELHINGDGKYLENGNVVVKKNGKKYNLNGQEIN